MTLQLTDEHYKVLIGRARASFDEKGSHVPMILAFGREGIAIIPFDELIADGVPRRLTYAVLRHVLRIIGAGSYVLISEAWRARSIPASQCPDRFEILQVIGHFPDGRVIHTTMRIENKKIVGEPEAFGTGTGETMGGGMANLLNEKPGTENFEKVAAEFARRFHDQILRN